jgi:hypothetical protein
MGTLKATLIVLFVFALIMVTMAVDVSARLEGRWALQAGNIITGEDFSVQHPMATIFHQQSVSVTDREKLDLSFPLFTSDSQLGSTQSPATTDGVNVGAGGSSNILPFGPVDLAFPSIKETVDRTATSSSTGFVKANWAYISDVASSNLGSAPLGISLDGGHPFKSNKMVGSEFLWPYMTPISQTPITGLEQISNNVKIDKAVTEGGLMNSSGGSTPVNVASNLSSNITFMDNGTPPAGNLSAHPGWEQRMPRVNPRSTKEQIKAMSGLERMYRNAFIGSTMYRAYEGPTQYPAWIDPYDNGRGVFNQIDMKKIIQVALKKTRPGERIAPVFWDL